jgi:hypothetical protein
MGFRGEGLWRGGAVRTPLAASPESHEPGDPRCSPAAAPAAAAAPCLRGRPLQHNPKSTLEPKTPHPSGSMLPPMALA